MANKRYNKKGTNLEDVQEMNRSLVIRLLRKMQVCSRAELAKETGLKQATITNIVNDLMDWGLVKETGIIEGAKGRRSIGIAFNSDLYKVVGVRLARKYFSVGLFDLAGTEHSIETQSIDITSGPDTAFKKMKKAIQKTLQYAGKERVIGIGIAIPGPFFRDEGRIGLMTEFPRWERILIQDELQKDLGLPVYLEHDANAGALAEWWFGPHSREMGTMIYIAAGQGVGAGIVINGKIFRGSLGTAGEIGHMSISFDGPKCECGNNGCLEHYCSTIALTREIEKNMPNYPKSLLINDSSFKSIIKAVEKDDELAVKVFRQTAWYLGFGLSSIINSFNPDVLVIGDELAQAGTYLLRVVRDTIKEHVIESIYKSVAIELTSFEKDPALIGASALAVDKILKKPSYFKKLAQ